MGVKCEGWPKHHCSTSWLQPWLPGCLWPGSRLRKERISGPSQGMSGQQVHQQPPHHTYCMDLMGTRHSLTQDARRSPLWMLPWMKLKEIGSFMNMSQISYEWPVTFLDVVEWVQHPKKSGVFFHEENIFSLWTMKVMEVDARKHMVIFLCIDYTIWPGWNHRGVYLLSREQVFKGKIKRKLSDKAHRRMRMVFDRKVNTTTCEPDDYLSFARERWHPHKKINKALIRAPVSPYISRKHRRNLNVLD